MVLSSVSLLILGVIFGTSLNVKGRSFLAAYNRHIFTVSAMLLFLYATYQSSVLYEATYSDPIGKFFDVRYFIIFRAGVRIFAPYLVSLIVAFLFMFVAVRYNRKYNDRFFEKEEIQIGGLSLLLIGHPGWIFYLIALIGLYLLLHTTHYLLHTNREFRLPIYYLWVPTAIFVILISKYWLLGSTLWSLLTI